MAFWHISKRSLKKTYIKELLKLSGGAVWSLNEIATGRSVNFTNEIANAYIQLWPTITGGFHDTSLRPLNEAEWLFTVFEFAFLYLYLTDSIAIHKGLDDKKRKTLISELEKNSVEYFMKVLFQSPIWTREKLDELKQDLCSLLLSRKEEYQRFRRWFPKDNEEIEGTLLYEFCNTIAGELSHKGDVRYQLAIGNIVQESVKALEIESFIMKFK